MVAAPIKIIRLDEDVVTMFRHAIYSSDGLEIELIDHVAPKTYAKFKKALTALGGRWDRKQNPHIFEVDPRTQIEGIIENGTLTVERDGFFPTPPKVTRYILGRMALRVGDYNWLEPEAGDGAMVKVLREEGFLPERIYAIEQNASRCAELRKLGVRVACGDFLAYRHTSGVIFHRIIMNPPFENNQDILHVLKAYKVLAEGGVMAAIMSEGVFFRENGLAKEFRRWLDSVHAYTERLPENSFKESGTGVATRFIVVRK